VAQICPYCGGPKVERAERCRKCYRLWAMTPANPKWRGGMLRDQGYIYILAPDHPRANRKGYVKRADLVLEQKLGRQLQPWEIAHHKDGVRDNDQPDNLEPVTNPRHGRMAKTLFQPEAKHPRWRGARICPRCGGRKKGRASLCRCCHVETGGASRATKKGWGKRKKKGDNQNGT